MKEKRGSLLGLFVALSDSEHEAFYPLVPVVTPLV